MELRLDHDYPMELRHTVVQPWQFLKGLPIQPCSVCGVLPHIGCYAPCGHTFCRDCGTAMENMSASVCPLDKIPLNDACSSGVLRACVAVDETMIREAKVVCRWSRQGQCPWTGPFAQLRDHQEKCFLCPRCHRAIKHVALMHHLLEDTDCVEPTTTLKDQEEKEQENKSAENETQLHLVASKENSGLKHHAKDGAVVSAISNRRDSSGAVGENECGSISKTSHLEERIERLEGKIVLVVNNLQDQLENQNAEFNEELSRLRTKLKDLEFEAKLNKIPRD